MAFGLGSLGAVGTLVTLIPQMEAIVASFQTDPAFAAALASAPVLSAKIALVSAEGRAVENDYQGVTHDKNFFSILNAFWHLTRDAASLKATVTAETTDPALLAEIAASPVIQAKLAAFAALWTQAQHALAAV